VRTDAPFGSVRCPQVSVPHRLVGGSEQRLGLACGTRVISLERATRVHDERRERAEGDRGAAGEPRREDDEQDSERCELQHRTQLREDALRDALLDIAHMCRQRCKLRDVRVRAKLGSAELCLTMIALSRSLQRGDTVNAVEHLEPELRGDLACDARLCPSRRHATDELGARCDQAGNREPQHGIAATELLEHLDGSSVHRARAPGERTREDTAGGREKRVAGSVHQRAENDGDPQ
jgi:hypothetical protein